MALPAFYERKRIEEVFLPLKLALIEHRLWQFAGETLNLIWSKRWIQERLGASG